MAYRYNLTIAPCPQIVNLRTLLYDIDTRFISFNKDDYWLQHRVFDVVFWKLHNSMKYVDRYYNQYSVREDDLDRLRFIKPNEFDITISIGLPLDHRSDRNDPNNSDIVLKHLYADCVKLKIGAQFERLPYRDNWFVNRTLFSWKDDNCYLLRSSFSNWFKGLVNRALRRFEGTDGQRYISVDGVRYEVGVSESGTALKLKISGVGFKMDVDLLPALQFPVTRYPSNLRRIPTRTEEGDIFLIIPNRIKYDVPEKDEDQSWRLSLIHQETDLLYGSYSDHILPYLKKLRDSLGMVHISSYHIKTLFLWERLIERETHCYRREPTFTLFIIMVKKFQRALEEGNIPNFWYSKNNLIKKVPRHLLVRYAAQLKKLVRILDDPSQYKKVADYMLTPNELADYQHILARAR